MKLEILRASTLVLLLCCAITSSASDNSVTIFPAEGNKQCSDYSANGTILQMSSTSPGSGGILSGTENPNDADYTGESASYVIDGGTVASFSNASTPIDYVLLKSSKYISVIIYPSGGKTSDANMTIEAAGQVQPITAISLCYGLGNQVPPPPPPPAMTTLKSCNTSASLDETGVLCSGTTERTLVCNFELDKPFYGLKDGSDTCCVCNSDALSECDPNVPAGSLNACPLTQGDPMAPEVTSHLELNNDPYYCTTVGGIRKCYSY